MDTDRDTPETDDIHELAMLFRLASRLMARAYHSHDHGPHTQEHVLDLVRRRGAMAQAELMELLDMRAASVSELLAKLEKTGRIHRERNPDDKRGFIVRPAATGCGEGSHSQGRSEAPSQAARESAEAIFGVLDLEERRQLWALLQKLAAPLRGQGSSGPHWAGGGNGRGRGQGRCGGPGGERGRGRGRRGLPHHDEDTSK